MKKTQFWFSCCILLIAACNPEEKQPSFIYIDEIITSSNYEREGSNRHEITDVWLFGKNAQDLGVWPIPATVPIFDEGITNVIAFAGIKNNNQTGNRKSYLMFKSDSIEIDIIPGEIYSFTPEVSYKGLDTITFELLNDFENSNGLELIAGNAEFGTTETDVFEGSRSLKVTIDEQNTSFNIQTIENLFLPNGIKDIYIEMHYKNDAVLLVALEPYTSNGAEQSIAVLNIGPKEDWEKIYIPLTDLTSNINAESYKLLLQGLLPDSLQSATFLFDNLKVIYEN